MRIVAFRDANVVIVHIVSAMRRLFLSEESLFFRVRGVLVRRASLSEFVERAVSPHERGFLNAAVNDTH